MASSLTKLLIQKRSLVYSNITLRLEHIYISNIVHNQTLSIWNISSPYTSSGPVSFNLLVSIAVHNTLIQICATPSYNLVDTILLTQIYWGATISMVDLMRILSAVACNYFLIPTMHVHSFISNSYPESSLILLVWLCVVKSSNSL